MIHHIQNLEDRLGNITTTNTAEDDHLDGIEREAYEEGNIAFRNWTDSLQEGLYDDTQSFDLVKQNPFNIKKLADKGIVFITKPGDGKGGVENPNWEGDASVLTLYNMDKAEPWMKVAVKNLMPQAIPYIQKDQDKLLYNGKYNQILWGIEKKGLNPEDFYLQEGYSLNENKYIDWDKNYGKTFKIVHTPKGAQSGGEWSPDLVSVVTPENSDAWTDWKEIAPESLKNWKKNWNNLQKSLGDHKYGQITRSMDKLGIQEKKVKDPFGLNAFAYELARLDEEPLNEGRYDKLTNQLSRIAFEVIKDGHDVGRKVVDTTFVVGPADEDPDIVSDDFEFDFRVQAEYTKDEYKVDGGANAGFDDEGDEIQPLLSIKFKIPKEIDWQTVSFDLKDVVRHEIEHLTQDGANLKGGTDSEDPKLVRPSKYMEDDQFIRDMIDADFLPKADYFKLEKEIDAMLQGLYYKAKKSRRPFKDVIAAYLATQPLSTEDKETILNLWRKRNKALALPLFEDTPKPKKYTIFCDMDGVIVDFDEGYKQLTGMSTHHADAQGKKEFWKAFRQGLVDKDISEESYWANLDWQPGGKELWDYISQYKPYVLTAPAVNFDLPDNQRYSQEYNESMKGKLNWVKRLPNMRKIYFAAAKNKAKFARPNHILIDDRKDTIDAWNANGGIGILYQSAQQVIEDLKKLGL